MPYIFSMKEKVSCTVVSNSLRFHELQPVPLLCPWNSPGKSTGVGGHFLLQVIFPSWGLNPGLPHCRQILYQLNHREAQLTWKRCTVIKHEGKLKILMWKRDLHIHTCWEPLRKIILISMLSISNYVCTNVPFYLGSHPILYLKLKGNPPSQRAIKVHENEEKLAGIMEF